MVKHETECCRLCGGMTEAAFRKRVLGKYDVRYDVCQVCRSLQTEAPHWLSEAYASSNLAALDTGAAHRNLNNLGMTWMLTRVLGLRDILDFGGGDGLLCRLLRDLGLNCYVRDEYASATYVRAFTRPTFECPQLVLAFEVMEHLPAPRSSLPKVFACGADVVLATTELYAGQDASWWYLVPEEGQHVFFYSEHAVRQLAARFGYQLSISGGYLLFTRESKVSSTQLRLLRLLMRPRVVKLARLVTAALPAHGVMKDFAEVRSRGVTTEYLPAEASDARPSPAASTRA